MYEIANIPPGNYFLSASAQPWYAGPGNLQHSPVQLDNTQPGAVNSTLDVAYPSTFYPNAIDSDDAIPIPIRGGERIEANMTLNAQHAMRLQLPLASSRDGGFGVSLAQNVFGQLEQMPTSIQLNNEGGVEISGVLPGQYEVTVTRSEGQSPPESTHFTADIADGATQLAADSDVGEVTVSGKVTSLDSKIRFAGISLAALHPQRNYFAPLNDAGDFTLQVPPGEYQVIGQISQMYLASVSSPNAVVKGRVLQVQAGAAPKLEIVAGNGYGQVEGVAERDGRPASGVMVLPRRRMQRTTRFSSAATRAIPTAPSYCSISFQDVTVCWLSTKAGTWTGPIRTCLLPTLRRVFRSRSMSTTNSSKRWQCRPVRVPQQKDKPAWQPGIQRRIIDPCGTHPTVYAPRHGGPVARSGSAGPPNTRVMFEF